MQMEKRSLNTYMNALTGNDFTVYPFSTKDPQDFRNLLSVYLDWVFFREITENEFDQEAHRTDVDGDKTYLNGIVYNEMKGMMDDPNIEWRHKISEKLY